MAVKSNHREAHVEVLIGLHKMLVSRQDDPNDPPCTSASYLRDFIRRAIAADSDMPTDKLARWVGFIQGVMAARGWLDVEAERNRTRPIFTSSSSAELSDA